jgi:putative endonuclease
MKGFYYVYILVSETSAEVHYTDLRRNLVARVDERNRGECIHTSNYRPWRIETAVAFRSQIKADDSNTTSKPAPAANSSAAIFTTAWREALLRGALLKATATKGMRPKVDALPLDRTVEILKKYKVIK